MRINTTAPLILTIESKTVQEVENFCCLGSILAKDGGGGASVDAKSRTQKARQASICLNNIWNATQFMEALEAEIFRIKLHLSIALRQRNSEITSKIPTHSTNTENKLAREDFKCRIVGANDGREEGADHQT